MISRMDSNRLKIHFEDTNVSELLTFVCEEQVEIQKKNISLIQNINPDIYCEVDRLLITRLFVNIISNAYQYSEENTKIEVNLYEENNKVVFSVKDEGIGIAKEDIEKIWDRFYQVDSSRVEDGNSSSGLGLPMVKWIAECHKGNLEVISELNKGSTFIFRIDNNGVL
jgi:signal transduction histidine kinase